MHVLPYIHRNDAVRQEIEGAANRLAWSRAARPGSWPLVSLGISGNIDVKVLMQDACLVRPGISTGKLGI